MAATVSVHDFQVARLNIGPTDTLDLNSASSYGIVSGTVLSPVPTPYSQIYAYVQNGCNYGTWDGVGGIASSAAAANSSLGLALVSGDDYLNILGKGTFFGHEVRSNDSLIRCTQYGDVNLDGEVNGYDYMLIDIAYQGGGSAGGYFGWIWGDCNYDGSIDSVDYSLMNYPIPEPTTFVLLGMGVVGFIAFAWRRKS